MSERHGVGVNGEPDDFAARYDNMLVNRGAGWIVKVVVGAVLTVVVAGVIWSMLPLS